MDEDIAVVGIGCSFPGGKCQCFSHRFSLWVLYINTYDVSGILAGEGLDNFWKVLVDGKNCAVAIPEQRFDITQWYDPDDSSLGKIQTMRAAFIDG